ncbi:4-hydroxythreonine-4-phosphate dehydrogenase PdxA [Candidatus Pelagibacter communis]|uniref:4-hydroxythreonine-4-phosphate dehydrogenase PdxA n=1 Tax=Pelagibacter ubique TaxID=198252 RepID=UPI00094DE9B0|nr:4-hydroxythreonine-4-phosphate dehydrogenase PdxA [Candidatus Pelagibacter ubique]
MNSKYILIVSGEPNSIFSEILFKALKKKKFKNPIILISSKKIIELQMRYLNFKKKIRVLDFRKLNKYKLDNKSINLINVNYNQKRPFEKITTKSNNFISESFKLAIKIVKKYKIVKFINGPIVKKTFLQKKYLGITEYISKKFDIVNNAMLIYNKNLSVCPLTTHLPLKSVARKVTKKNILDKTELINNFYKKRLNKKPKIAILGLNPHCESISKFNEDEKIIKPAIKQLNKKGFNVSGPFSADTFFIKKNRKKFDVVLGMYHDQVLTPIKTLYEYDAINITLGLPFIRISPDHGPNEKMLGKNLSNPTSLIQAIKFLDKS